MVIRTGYYSVEGSLLHSMVYMNKSFSHYSNSDLLNYILILLLLSLLSIVYLYIYYWIYPNVDISNMKLFIHSIMIITSTVPPELPMEMTLSVTEAMEDLKNHRIIIILY